MRQRLIPLDSPGAWSAALDGVPHTFGHTREHCIAVQATSGLPTALYCMEDGDARVLCPLSVRAHEGWPDLVKPQGYSGFVGTGSPADFASRWQIFARERGYVCGYLGLSPVFDPALALDAAEVEIYDTVYVMDVSRADEEMLAGMAKKRRQQLRQAERAGTRFVHDREALRHFLLRHYAEFLRERNASPFHVFAEATVARLCEADAVSLVGAADAAGRIVAVFAYGSTPYCADALFLVSLAEGQRFSAPLLWYAARELRARGVPLLNLGGGGGSYADFKRRFGCEALPLRSLKQVYRPDVYADLCRRAGAEPMDRSGYFPAYRRGAPGVRNDSHRQAPS